MSFALPTYCPPDFTQSPLAEAPTVRTEPAPHDGVAPDQFHATSNHPEYVHLDGGDWHLVRESRMDCVMVLRDSRVEVVEPRRLKQGDKVVIGRTENGEDGVYVHVDGFKAPSNKATDKFSFRTRGTRESPFSRSYDELYELLRHDREHGHIAWVLGPAVAFDRDSRCAMQGLIEEGYCDALLAGNALATHDLEAACFGTGLGCDIYCQRPQTLGHYNHLDVLNRARGVKSLNEAIDHLKVTDGIMWACRKHDVPVVLAGSIRDDGPLPQVMPDVYAAQNAMREHARKATTVICMATQLHSIAFGNMTPGYHVNPDGSVRPVYFYIIDMTEFSADKLANRGSAQATAILTNVQDFLVNLWNNLKRQ